MPKKLRWDGIFYRLTELFKPYLVVLQEVLQRHERERFGEEVEL